MAKPVSAQPKSETYDPVAEARAVAVERARRDRSLTPTERLERLHQICASLARMQR
jgi:hypothetical protein